ncbi:Hypothetical predicted protein [Podarcis lilfordi]|uniref:Uncharacterized protein n=1 Tax=Podarcis lilfordi TaxID=74358 RepID=A0AA35P3X6_9SAUR|nr:Hypothetical predicted protein [Podarcis lilfordi]
MVTLAGFLSIFELAVQVQHRARRKSDVFETGSRFFLDLCPPPPPRKNKQHQELSSTVLSPGERNKEFESRGFIPIIIITIIIKAKECAKLLQTESKKEKKVPPQIRERRQERWGLGHVEPREEGGEEPGRGARRRRRPPSARPAGRRRRSSPSRASRARSQSGERKRSSRRRDKERSPPGRAACSLPPPPAIINPPPARLARGAPTRPEERTTGGSPLPPAKPESSRKRNFAQES